MLKVSSIRDDGPDRRLFEIRQNGSPADPESLNRVVLYAAHLLRENELPGVFRVAGDGLLALELPSNDRSFFHDGILFAALDVFNNPNKNPTITRLSVDGQ